MESLEGMRILMPDGAAYIINLRALAPSRFRIIFFALDVYMTRRTRGYLMEFYSIFIEILFQVPRRVTYQGPARG